MNKVTSSKRTSDFSANGKMSTRLFILLLVCGAALSAKAESVVSIGSRKQLFIDKKFIQSDTGIELRMNPPVKAGVVLKGEKPWELGWLFGYGTVLEDSGVYKAWYTACPVSGYERFNDYHERNETYLCYAESKDGVQWNKPNLGIYEWHGSKANNILLRVALETSTVFVDPKAPEAARYKLLANIPKTMSPPNGPGVYIYTSPDGLRWKLNPTLLFPFLPDSQNQVFFDTRVEKYVIYARIWDPLRKVGRIETGEILQPWPYDKNVQPSRIWGIENTPPPSREMPTAFGYDEQDPASSDHYTSAAVQYPWAQDAYFMFPSAYLHYPDPPKGRFRNDGPVDIQMAVSRDGVKFHRVERAPYIGLGVAGAEDAGSIYMLVGMVRNGDELYQYYSAQPFTHGAIPEEIRGLGAIVRVAQRVDGFVSADAGMSGGSFTTPPLRFEGRRLSLNLNASALGEVLVELRDKSGSPIRGFTFAESDPIQGNHVARVVTWSGKADIGKLASHPVQVAFKLRSVKLYAFHFLN
jgi:hypothetical protein